MKVLVSGGLGYLGSVLIQKLLEQNFEVKVLDESIYGYFLPKKELELIRGDIRDYKLARKAIEDVDAIIHLAGIIGDAAANLNRELTINVNYIATRRLAKLCSERNVRFIFSSTCSVYGARPNEMITEKSEIAPLSLYAMSKMLAEDAIRRCCDNYAVFRLGTLFGLSPRMRFDLVVNRFIAQAIQEKSITIYGGRQHRPFVHIQDVSDIFVKALDKDVNDTYNLGGENYMISDVAKIIEQKTGCRVILRSDINDPRNYAVDSTFAKKTLGFKVTKNIEYAVSEIRNAYDEGIIKDYTEPIFNNGEWLRRLWQQEPLLQVQQVN